MSERLILVCILSICGHVVAGSQYAAGPELHQELGITQKQFRANMEVIYSETLSNFGYASHDWALSMSNRVRQIISNFAPQQIADDPKYVGLLAYWANDHGGAASNFWYAYQSEKDTNLLCFAAVEQTMMPSSQWNSAVFDELLALESRGRVVQIAKSMVFLQIGDFSRALDEVSHISGSDGDVVAALIRMQCLLLLRRAQDAVPDLTLLANSGYVDPRMAHVILRYAQASTNRELRRSVGNMMSLPGNQRARTDLIYCSVLLQDGETNRALPVFLRVIRSDPTNQSARMGAIEILLGQNRLEELKKLCGTLAETSPHPRIGEVMAAAGMNTGDIEYAMRGYEIGYQSNTLSDKSLTMYARLLEELGDSGKASNVMRKVQARQSEAVN